MYFKFTTAPLNPTGDPFVKLDKCGYFDQARLDQRFEVVDEEIVSICSKFARSKLHVFLNQQDLTGSRARFLEFANDMMLFSRESIRRKVTINILCF